MGDANDGIQYVFTKDMQIICLIDSFRMIGVNVRNKGYCDFLTSTKIDMKTGCLNNNEKE